MIKINIATVYSALIENIENAVSRGYERAYKYTDAPTKQQIKDEIVSAVELEICEWIVFESPIEDE